MFNQDVLALIPEYIQNLGSEIGNAWPIFVLIATVAGVSWRGVMLLRKTINDAVDPLTEEIHKTGIMAVEKIEAASKPLNSRLQTIELQLFPNGGYSLRDKLDQVGAEVSSIKNIQSHGEALTQTFFEASPQAMYRSNEEGITIQCNQAYLDFWGFADISEAKSNDWLARVEDRALAEERLKTIIRSPGDFIYTSNLMDGRKLRVVGHPIFERGEFAGYVGYVADTTKSDEGTIHE